MAGRSLAPLFRGEAAPARGAPLFWEHEGNRAVRQGKWKLVRAGTGLWELYDVEKDRVELNDLANANPARVESMDSLWGAWADANFVRREPPTGFWRQTGDESGRGPGVGRAKDALGRPASRRPVLTAFPYPIPISD